MTNVLKENLNEIRARILLAEASRWLGCQEVGADNFGQVVGLFQRLHGAFGQSWCAHFVLYCLHHTDRTFNTIFELRPEDIHAVFPSGSVNEMWEHSPKCLRRKVAEPGLLAVWQFDEDSGHVGIVQSVNGKRMVTIEGNTHPDNDKDGKDGVYLRSRSAVFLPGSKMKLLGFLSPWDVEYRRVVVHIGN